MYNMILDRLPTEYEGYLMRTSFRIGIQICLCLKDPEFSQEEQLMIALDLLYGQGLPQDLNLAVDGLSWFLSGGNPSKKGSGDNKELFYWDFDHARLYSSFMQTYGIDLTKEDMHWFKFISLIGSLDKNCAFNKAVEIRGHDMKNMTASARNELQKLKRELTPETEYSTEEQEQIDKFNALFSGGEING